MQGFCDVAVNDARLFWSEGSVIVFFFFQAEDGIRDLTVTGVQTCALPISGIPGTRASQVHGSQTSRMMAVMPWSDYTVFSDPPGPNLLQLYQVPAHDCGHPVLVGTYDFGPIIPHEFQIWHDKIYVTNFGGSPGPSLMVIDVQDMAHPPLLTN